MGARRWATLVIAESGPARARRSLGSILAAPETEHESQIRVGDPGPWRFATLWITVVGLWHREAPSSCRSVTTGCHTAIISSIADMVPPMPIWAASAASGAAPSLRRRPCPDRCSDLVLSHTEIVNDAT